MKARFIISLSAIMFSAILYGQYPQRSWIDNYSYNKGLFAVAGNNKIFCCTSSGIIVADMEYSSVARISTVTGLTESILKTIGWSSETSTLIIAYSSSNIDLLRGNEITNIPEVMRKSIPGLKEIYRIRTRGSYAYLATSFGIVIVDLVKNEIHDTWKPGTGADNNPVYDITFADGKVLAATSSGIYEASLTNPGLAFFGNWIRHEGIPSPSATYNCITSTESTIFTNKPGLSGDSVFMYSNNSWQLIHAENGVSNKSFEMTSLNELLISSGSGVKIFSQAGVLLRTVDEYFLSEAKPSDAIKTGNLLWIADTEKGLVSVDQSGFATSYLPDGPMYNSVASITAVNGDVYATGGAVDNAWNNTWKVLEVSFLNANKWTSLPVSALRDAMRVVPGKENNYFVSTWGMGLLEYSDTTLLNHYNEYNSPLNSIIPGQPFTRLCGLAFDKDDNLWIVHSGVPGNIKILKPDRTWFTLPVTIEAPTIGDIIITKSGLKWIVLPRGYGLFIIDDNGTPFQSGDDTYRKMIVRDTDDKIISNVYSVTEDLDGNIWVGTDQGPAIYYNPERAAEEDIKAVRIKIPRNDGTGLADYMLGTEIITSIAIDGANRKWVGTFNSGTYLLSADGTEKISHFTADNSPLPSNTIVSVSADMSTGIIWFGTPSGIIAFRGDAPAGNQQFTKVYAYPNPVRPGYEGLLTISGLVRDSNIKITDISGNLVYETTSTGGEATWDLLNYRGERVSSGVYLIFCASPDGTGSAITKVLVIKGN